MKMALYGHVCPERGIKQYYNNDMCLKSRDIEHIFFKNLRDENCNVWDGKIQLNVIQGKLDVAQD